MAASTRLLLGFPLNLCHKCAKRSVIISASNRTFASVNFSAAQAVVGNRKNSNLSSNLFSRPRRNQHLSPFFAYRFFSIGTVKLSGLSSTNSSLNAGVSSPDIAGNLDEISDKIPDIPSLLPGHEELLAAAAEPIYSSSSWFLSNWLAHVMDYAHAATGLHWWEVIVVTTIGFRFCVLPFLLVSQRNAACMHNAQPDMQKAQEKMLRSQAKGDLLECQEAQTDYKDALKRNGVNPMRTIYVLLASGSVFITFFWALKAMTRDPPRDGFKTEGLAWFKDLTEKDKSYILPGICAATLLAIMALGAETGVSASSMPPAFKFCLYGSLIPVIAFTSQMPSAMLCYWITSNTFSLTMALALKIPALRRAARIPELKKHDPNDLPLSNFDWKKRWSMAKKASKPPGGFREQMKMLKQEELAKKLPFQAMPQVQTTRELRRHMNLRSSIADLEKKVKERKTEEASKKTN